MSNPFDLCDAVIRDLPHVRVTRHAPCDGKPCEYRKTFKAEGLRDANYWTQRENDFLLDFRKLRHTVQLSSFTQDPNGHNTPVFEAVATYDAGITIEDWLRVKPKYAKGETYAHPFKHTGIFLSLIRACLIALKEIHTHRLVHCDIKPDNICLPYSPYPYQPGKPIRIDFDHIRLIDFAFAIRADRPLEHPLPIGAKAAYQSDLLKAALTKDLDHKPRETLCAQQLDCRADLYSLGFMADHILHLGLLQPQGIAGRAAQEGAHRIVERLKAFDNATKPWDGMLPHDSLIADIDTLLAPLTDMDSYREFNVDSYQDISSCAQTPMAPVAKPELPEAQNVGYDSIEKKQILFTIRVNP